MAFVKPGSATMNGESLWSRLAGLALIVERCEYDRVGCTNSVAAAKTCRFAGGTEFAHRIGLVCPNQ